MKTKEEKEQLKETYERIKKAVRRGQMRPGDIQLRDIYFGDDKTMRYQSALIRGSHIRQDYPFDKRPKTVLNLIEKPRELYMIRNLGKKGREVLRTILKCDFDLDLPTEAPERSPLEQYNILMKNEQYREAGDLAKKEHYPKKLGFQA